MKETNSKEILTPKLAKWSEFTARLEGPEGCDFKDDQGRITWNCKGGNDKSFARKILATMPDVDVEGTLNYCHEHGGHCDCEILFNVDGGV